MAKKDDERTLDAATKAVEEGKVEHSEEVAAQIVSGHAAPIDSGMAGPREQQEAKVLEGAGLRPDVEDSAVAKDVLRGRSRTLDVPSDAEIAQIEDASRAVPGIMAAGPLHPGMLGTLATAPQKMGVTINGVHMTFTPGDDKKLPAPVAGVLENKLTPFRTDQMKGIGGVPIIDLDAD